MKIDAIVAEIGSTTTVVNAFDNINTNNPIFIGQGKAFTSILEGDVNIGLKNAINDLKQNLEVNNLEFNESFACSSAAGGLKMSVHGLVYDMTVKAAKEAALGAGANIKLVTSGKLSKFDINKIKDDNLNIIMIAGGVDYGESFNALNNAKEIAKLHLNIPVIYSGNIINHDEIKEIFELERQIEYLYITPNVYPKIDQLNIEPVRKIIQDVFEKHIINAPGMENVRLTINQNIIPTPGAVLEASILLQKEIGDLITVDVGGATTDIHSVTTGSLDVQRILINPEPFAKRTVEGDLGVYINRDNIINLIGKENLAKRLNISLLKLDDMLNNYQAIPNNEQISLVEHLTYEALNKGIERHAGRYIQIYGTSGRTKMAEGKDLTNVSYLIATGGALTRLPKHYEIIHNMLQLKDDLLLKPYPNTKILIDKHYIMATLGVLSKKYPIAALRLLKNSLEIR